MFVRIVNARLCPSSTLKRVGTFTNMLRPVVFAKVILALKTVDSWNTTAVSLLKCNMAVFNLDFI